VSTQQDLIYHRIRQRLLNGEWRPGQRMVEQTLAAELGVNRNPVREALLKLAGEGFLERQPGSGCRVMHIGLDQLTHLYEARAAIETAAARLAARRLTPAQLERLRAEHELIQRLTRLGQEEDLFEAEQRFHGMLVQFSGNPVLMHMWEQCRVLELTRLVFRLIPPTPRRTAFGTQRITHRGHARVVDALSKGDPDDAARAVDLHARQSIRYLQRLARMGRIPLTSQPERD
jgi:DNA-binding GntR family transcriptional regulator